MYILNHFKPRVLKKVDGQLHASAALIRYPLDGSLRGLQIRSKAEENNRLLQPGIEPRHLRHPARSAVTNPTTLTRYIQYISQK